MYCANSLPIRAQVRAKGSSGLEKPRREEIVLPVQREIFGTEQPQWPGDPCFMRLAGAGFL
jgi:hypothetical protein